MKQFQRLIILTKNSKPSEHTFLKPEGFKTAEEEYKFFYETESSFFLECPDGEIRSVKALNYYWEALCIIEKILGVTAKQIAKEAWDLNSLIDPKESEFYNEFRSALINQIEDYMEE